jgi:hypothetical protein
MADRPISVAETDLFVRQANDVWDAVERHAFAEFIARNPEVGDIIPDTGEVRKPRWRKAGMGERGGVRVVYFFTDSDSLIYLLMVYAPTRRHDAG